MLAPKSKRTSGVAVSLDLKFISSKIGNTSCLVAAKSADGQSYEFHISAQYDFPQPRVNTSNKYSLNWNDGLLFRRVL